MKIEEFIEKVIKGGWLPKYYPFTCNQSEMMLSKVDKEVEKLMQLGDIEIDGSYLPPDICAFEIVELRDSFRQALERVTNERDTYWKEEEMGVSSDCWEHEKKLRAEFEEKEKLYDEVIEKSETVNKLLRDTINNYEIQKN